MSTTDVFIEFVFDQGGGALARVGVQDGDDEAAIDAGDSIILVTAALDFYRSCVACLDKRLM